jgi:hypothetical protein
VEDIPHHIFALAEHSELVSLIGLPWSVWVVREFLPTMPIGHCPRYGNMPVCREFRFFVDGGKVECRHPYWPRSALEQGGFEIDGAAYERLCSLVNIADAERLAARAGDAVGGAWSVDILDTKRGWFITDMAEAGKSFHWDGCPNAAR